MGIVESNEKSNLLFLHSTSGKAYGVVIAPLKGYYEARFVKVIRVFPQIYFTTTTHKLEMLLHPIAGFAMTHTETIVLKLMFKKNYPHLF